MGKRNKEQNHHGRRRPMIQLGGSTYSSNVSSVSRVQQKEEVVEKTDPMEDAFAGFMAEINSMDAIPQPAEDLPTPVVAKDPNIYDAHNFDPSTQGHLLPPPWQAIYDDSTAYYYYWNQDTNEVQWTPPEVTAPPPPPPPPLAKEHSPSPIKDSIPEVAEKSSETSGNDEKVVLPLVENSVKESNALTNLGVFSSYPDSSEDEEENNKKTEDVSKNKDKELMSQIKEKIQKKKEEKERQKQKDQQDKEEMLREKLLKKKAERDKASSSADSQEKLDDDKEDSFTVDIFAQEDKSEKKKQESDAKNKQESNENSTKTETTKENGPADSETVPEIEIKTNNKDDNKNNDIAKKKPAENKGSWRIVDAVYEDEDTNSESEISELTKSEEPKKPVVVVTEKKCEAEMDDYADMLLEEGIEEDAPCLPKEAPPPLPEHEERPPLPTEDEPLPELPKLSSKEVEDNRKEIRSLSTELFEKLDFLGISGKDLRKLQLRFIELETRVKDWQAGALETHYFLLRLREMSDEIIEHEKTAAPPGWLCHWSTEFSMYYYHNEASGESQWEYPASAAVPAEPIPFSINSLPIAPLPPPPIMSMLPPQMMPPLPPVMLPLAPEPPAMIEKQPSYVSPAQGFTRDPLPSAAKKSKKIEPNASPSTSVADPYRDPYRMLKASNVDQSETKTDESNILNESGTQSPLAAASPAISRVRESSPAIMSAPALKRDESPQARRSNSPQPSSAVKMNNILLKKEKKKRKVDSAGLPSKKLKHVSSLVNKWQSVKQKVQEEESMEDQLLEEEANLDFETASQKRIEEWKSNIEQSGEKEYNPNFTEIKGDWRERLKRKNTT